MKCVSLENYCETLTWIFSFRTLVMSAIYIWLCFHADRQTDRQTELFTSQWKSWDFFFFFLKVKLSCLSGRSLSAISIAKYWLDNMWFCIQTETRIISFAASSKWLWPNDKQQLGLWINRSMVHARLFDHFIDNAHTQSNTHTLTHNSCFFFFSFLLPTPQLIDFLLLFYLSASPPHLSVYYTLLAFAIYLI